MSNYSPRVVDQELKRALAVLPAISLEGAKAVGKTASALRLAAAAYQLDDETQRSLLAAALERIEVSPTPLLIDEWQREPAAWDAVRRAVDRDSSAGRFLLTGSAAPVGMPIHSGAGRIVALRMRPFSLAERGLAKPTVSLADLLGDEPVDIGGESAVTLAQYTDEILRSGFPGIRQQDQLGRKLMLDGYLSRIAERELPEIGFTVRRPAALRAWLTAYAAATAQTTSANALARAATQQGARPLARNTGHAYAETLAQLWILDPVPGWVPSRNHLKRAAQADKHHLVDPALAARLLGVSAGALLSGDDHAVAVPRDGSLLGALFESLVSQSVRVYAQASGATVSHFRESGGRHEIDLLVQRDDHRVLAFEVKLAGAVKDQHVRQLLWLRDQLGDDVIDIAVITSGPYAYRRADGVAVIPAALLGP